MASSRYFRQSLKYGAVILYRLDAEVNITRAENSTLENEPKKKGADWHPEISDPSVHRGCSTHPAGLVPYLNLGVLICLKQRVLMSLVDSRNLKLYGFQLVVYWTLL